MSSNLLNDAQKDIEAFKNEKGVFDNDSIEYLNNECIEKKALNLKMEKFLQNTLKQEKQTLEERNRNLNEHFEDLLKNHKEGTKVSLMQQVNQQKVENLIKNFLDDEVPLIKNLDEEDVEIADSLVGKGNDFKESYDLAINNAKLRYMISKLNDIKKW